MTKTKTYLLASIVSVLVLAIGVTFAYFTVQIQGTGKAMTVNTANLRVIFEDTNAAISATNIKPGTAIPSKTFTVESKTDAEYKYDIVIKNLVNTFVTEGYLQYQIVGSNGGVSQGWTDVPKSATATDTVLVHSVSLAVNAKHTYTVNFRYQNSESVDQSVDMGKSFSGSIMITEAVPSYSVTINLTNPGSASRFGGCDIYDDVDYELAQGGIIQAEGNLIGTIDSPSGSTIVNTSTGELLVLIKSDKVGNYMLGGSSNVVGDITPIQTASFDTGKIAKKYLVNSDGTITIDGVDYDD